MKTIKIYSGIYEDEYGVADISRDLEEAEGDDVHVKIHSGGGSVFTGLGIYDLLSSYSGNVTTEIVGLAGSMASIIFMAGSKRIVNSGFLMIHSPWVVSVGSSEDLREDADLLDQMRDQLINVYVKATGQDKDFLKEKMSKDTYMSAEELLELGFVTEIREGAKMVASINHFETKQKKEPQMAMTKEEKAQFEALEAKAEKFDSMEKIKAELEDKIKSLESVDHSEAIAKGIAEGMKAEKERKDGIMALCVEPWQAEHAETLYEDGMTVSEASIAILQHYKDNRGEHAKNEKSEALRVLESEAPKASTEKEQVQKIEKTDEEIYAEIRELKNKGDFSGATKLYAKLKGDK